MRISFLKSVALSTALFSMISCGSEDISSNNEDQVNEPTDISSSTTAATLTDEQQVQAKKEYQTLPAGVLVRVPLDSKGKELTTQSEVRVSNDSISSEQIATVWSGATTSTNLQSKSSDSTLNSQNSSNIYRRGRYGRGRYRAGRYYGRGYGRYGYGYGRRAYYGGYYRYARTAYRANYYYNSYRPAYYSNAYTYSYWGYNTTPVVYASSYYNYYYYSRPSCGIFSWCAVTY
jgi:hypothetical protein